MTAVGYFYIRQYTHKRKGRLKQVGAKSDIPVFRRPFLWGRYYFDTFIDKAKKGEIFKGNKILNKNSGKIGFDTFSFKVGRK